MQKDPHITNELNIFKLVKLLKKMDRFKSFSDTDIRLFLESGEMQEYEPNEIIFKEEEQECSVYFLLSGKLQVVKRDKIICTLNRTGDVFGEMGIIDGSARSATIKTVVNSLVLCVDGSTFNSKIEKGDYLFCYTLYRVFAEILVERLRVTTDDNHDLRKKLLLQQN